MSRPWVPKPDIKNKVDFPSLKPSTSQAEPVSKQTLEQRVFFLEQQVKELILASQEQSKDIRLNEEKAACERQRVARKEKAGVKK